MYQRLHFLNYVQVLTHFLPVICCCATSDCNCDFARFLVSNSPGNSHDVPAMHDISNSFVYKLPRCLTTSKVMLKAC